MGHVEGWVLQKGEAEGWVLQKGAGDVWVLCKDGLCRGDGCCRKVMLQKDR